MSFPGERHRSRFQKGEGERHKITGRAIGFPGPLGEAANGNRGVGKRCADAIGRVVVRLVVVRGRRSSGARSRTSRERLARTIVGGRACLCLISVRARGVTLWPVGVCCSIRPVRVASAMYAIGWPVVVWADEVRCGDAAGGGDAAHRRAHPQTGGREGRSSADQDTRCGRCDVGGRS